MDHNIFYMLKGSLCKLMEKKSTELQSIQKPLLVQQDVNGKDQRVGQHGGQEGEQKR